MIMLISFDASSRVFQVKVKLGKFVQYRMINRHSMITNHNTTI
jgi:hypothetical protein